MISIHALREESDRAEKHARLTMRISIHALREESDRAEKHARLTMRISIHALREESDNIDAVFMSQPSEFQSTLSVRRATRFDAAAGGDGADISIHALREESDLKPLPCCPSWSNFNPRSP